MYGYLSLILLNFTLEKLRAMYKFYLFDNLYSSAYLTQVRDWIIGTVW